MALRLESGATVSLLQAVQAVVSSADRARILLIDVVMIGVN